METSNVSQLPIFGVERLEVDAEDGSTTMLIVNCERKDCGGTFWVPLRWGTIHPVVGRSEDPPARPTGRPCPFCAKASHIPEEFRIYPDRPKRRPVRLKRRKRP